MVGKFLSERYELLEKIGEGGMANVYKAKCHVLSRFVAVKILKSEFNEDEEFIEKFDKESKSAAQLTHPNIVGIYDVGLEGDIRYIVMEYIEGVTLKKYMKQLGHQMTEQEILRITMQIASALDHAHKNNIIHRDIKPQNILMAKGGIAKVADFGIAQAITSSTIVPTKKMLGTVHYSSPEQTRGSFIDHRTDIYSLGIMMYEMSTGKLPFVGESAITVALKHMKEEVLPPKQINDDISEGLQNIILTALKKSADYRYQTIGEMMVDLTRVKSNPDENIEYSAEELINPTQFLPDIEEYENMGKEKSRLTSKKKKKKPTKKNGVNKLSMVTIVLLAFIAAVLIFGVIGFSILSDRFAYQEVEVPNVIDLPFEEAKDILNEVGFYIEEDGLRYSDVVIKGHVIEQSEDPGEILKEGFTIRVVVSKGKNMIEIPNLLQKDIAEAQIILENNELIVGDVSYIANDLPKGYIVSQSPEMGTEAQVGQVVDLVVSQGNSLDEYLMQKLLGMTYDEALERFDGTGINLLMDPVDSYIFSEYEKDLIAEQDIAQGTTIYPGNTIYVKISLGPILTSRKFTFKTEYFKEDTETVRVEVVKGEETYIAYSKVHQKSEEIIEVTIEESGEVTLNIYYGDELYNSLKVNFR
jgi:serine/threonine-protein kinase